MREPAAPAACPPPTDRTRAGDEVAADQEPDAPAAVSPRPSRSADRVAMRTPIRRRPARRPAAAPHVTPDRAVLGRPMPVPVVATSPRGHRARPHRVARSAAPNRPPEPPGFGGYADGPSGRTSPRERPSGPPGPCCRRSPVPGGPPATAPGTSAAPPRAPARPDQERKTHAGQAERHPAPRSARNRSRNVSRSSPVNAWSTGIESSRVLRTGTEAIAARPRRGIVRCLAEHARQTVRSTEDSIRDSGTREAS